MLKDGVPSRSLTSATGKPGSTHLSAAQATPLTRPLLTDSSEASPPGSTAIDWRV